MNTPLQKAVILAQISGQYYDLILNDCGIIAGLSDAELEDWIYFHLGI